MSILKQYSFASLADYIKAAETTDKGHYDCYEQYKGSHDRTYVEKFSGVRGWPHMRELALKGWPDGLKKLVHAMARTRHTVARRPKRRMDVAGAFPSVPLAVAGDPLYMVHRLPQDMTSAPVVRLAIQRNAMASYEVNEFENYGAAVMSYVDALEQSGIRCELNLLFHAEGQGKRKAVYSALVRIKNAESPMNYDHMAFCLIHAAVQRKISIVHRVGHNTSDLPGFEYAGRTLNPDKSILPHDMLLVPSMMVFPHKSRELASPEASLKALTPILEKMLAAAGVTPPELHFETAKPGPAE